MSADTQRPDVPRMNVLDRAARFRDSACTIPGTDIAETFAADNPGFPGR